MKAFLIVFAVSMGIGVSQAQIEVVKSVKLNPIENWDNFQYLSFGSEGCLAYSKKSFKGNTSIQDMMENGTFSSDIFNSNFPDWNFVSFDHNLGQVAEKQVHFETELMFNTIVKGENRVFFIYIEKWGKKGEIHTVSFPDLKTSVTPLKLRQVDVGGAVALGNKLVFSAQNSKRFPILAQVNPSTGKTEEIDLSKYDLGKKGNVDIKRIELINNRQMIAAHIRVAKNKSESASHLLFLNENGPMGKPIEIVLDGDVHPIDFSTIVLGKDDFVIVGTYGVSEEVVLGTFFQRHSKGQITNSSQEFDKLEQHQNFIKQSIEDDERINRNTYKSNVLNAQSTDNHIFLLNKAYYVNSVYTSSSKKHYKMVKDLSGTMRQEPVTEFSTEVEHNYVSTHIIGTCFTLDGQNVWCEVIPIDKQIQPMDWDLYSPTIHTLDGSIVYEPVGFVMEGSSPILVSPQGMEEINPFGNPEDLFRGASEEFISWYDDYSLRVILKPCSSSDENESDTIECGQTLQKVKVISLE